MRANGPITLIADSLTNGGTITNGGGANTPNIILSANAFDLAGGDAQGGAAAVVLRPRDGTRSFGIEAAGDTTLTNADIASINTSNFVVFGSGTGTIFTGNMTIGQNAQVDGGTKNLAFFRSSAPGGTTTIGSQGVTTTGDAIISAGGGAIVSNGGTVSADEVQLRASQGIGSAVDPVKTNANALAVNNLGSGGVFVSELNNVTLRTISLNVGGNLNTASSTNSGSFSLVSGGDVNVAGLVSSAGSMILDAGGNLKLDGSLVDAVLMSNGGQTITAQSIDLTAQNGRRANIENQGGPQEVTARSGGMNLQGVGGAGVAQIINNNNVIPGDQTINVAGQLDILGGSTNTGSTNSGIFKNGPGGLQKVTAAGITLQGASTGTNAGAGIRSQGDQLIDVSGDINLRGGNGGTNNNAFLSANPTTPGVVGKQTIYARDINMSNGVGGVDTTATITAGRQVIDVTGNVTLTAQGALLGTASGGPGVRIGAPGGTSLGTDLTLLVDGSVTLNGGSVAENGASIGSSGAGVPPAPNTIHIEAGGSVMLNAGTEPGTGVRIGSSSNGTAGGDISIKAVDSIQLNGTQRSAAIRTLGNVTLEGASITEGSNGLILADTLTTTTTGATSLIGQNDVTRFNGTSGGALTLVDAGGLQVTGIGTTNDAITLTTDSLTNGGVITNGGPSSTANIVLNADAFNLAAGTVEGGAAAVIVRPKTGSNSFGIESAGATMLTNADIASINTSDFVVFGSGMGTTFTGNMTIGQNARVEGGGKSLAFFRSSMPGGTTTIGASGVNSTGNVIVSAGGGAIVSNGGTVSGDQVQLRASQGIGSALARVQTAANRLALNNTGPQGAFVFEAGDVTLGNVNLTVGGNANNVANVIGGGGTYDVTAGGSITLSDLVQAGSVALATPSGSIVEVGGGAIVANSLTTSSARETSLTGANQVASFNGSTAFGAPSGDITLNNTGALAVTGLSAGNNARLTNSGAVSVTGGWFSFGETDIATTGGNLTVMSSLSSSRAMELDVGGTLTVSANGPQTAQLNANSGGQTITAQSVEVVAQNGGFATITNMTSGEQRITVSGGSVDVQVLNGFGSAQIFNTGGNQTVKVTDGDHIKVDGRAGTAVIFSASGTQDVSITGSGANAIMVGSTGAFGDSRIVGGLHQVVTAGADGERGSITIVGPDANSRLAAIQTNPVVAGTQTVSTSGTISVTGGRAAPQLANFQSGIFHNGSGLQTVNAARIELQGGPSGANNGAFISVLGGGVAANAGAQMINVTGDISIAGDAGGNAAISNLGNRKQTIFADNIHLTNSAGGGNNSGAFITGPQQEIHAAGDVTLTARASGGDLPGVRIGSSSTATNLELFVGGDLVLTGGTAVNNGVGIGSSGSGTPLANNIKIEAGGSVILNAGELQNTGVRIGSGSNGTAGRGHLHQGRRFYPAQRHAALGGDPHAGRRGARRGFDQRNRQRQHHRRHAQSPYHRRRASQWGESGRLTERPPGMPTMPSSQGIGGNLAFTNSSALNLSNVSVGGTLTLNNTASVAVSNAVTSGGAMNLDVAGDIAVTAGGLQDATLSASAGRPSTLDRSPLHQAMGALLSCRTTAARSPSR